MNVEPTNERVDSIFERYTKPLSPGCAVAVMKDGEMLYRQGYGLANLEHNAPNLPSTVFNIGSMAKQFTAFALALLEDAGQLSFDDDIRVHLPEMHDFGQTITIRHLVHHTSGLRGSFPELLALAEWRDADYTTTDDVFWLLKSQRELNYPPGQEHLYVNSGYVLLAKICERVSGQPFAEFSKHRIFDPLGMTRSFIHDSVFQVIPGCAQGYYYDDDKAGWFYAPLTDCVVGPSNVYTTVEDLALWDENSYSGQVGGPDGAIASMTTITPSGDFRYERVARVSPSPGALEEYVGRYHSPELDIYWTLKAGDGHLVARRRKYVDSKLTPLFQDAFSDDWMPIMGYPTTYLVRFERDAEGAITGLRVSGTRVRNLKFVRTSPSNPTDEP